MTIRYYFKQCIYPHGIYSLFRLRTDEGSKKGGIIITLEGAKSNDMKGINNATTVDRIDDNIRREGYTISNGFIYDGYGEKLNKGKINISGKIIYIGGDEPGMFVMSSGDILAGKPLAKVEPPSKITSVIAYYFEDEGMGYDVRLADGKNYVYNPDSRKWEQKPKDSYDDSGEFIPIKKFIQAS